MDSELIRTFIEVNRTRHFGRAAERLFVTPAAVSARIRLLEQQMGTRLFSRSRNNVGLTAAGQRLLPHAENLLRSWNRALLSVGTAEAYRELVALGCLPSIWTVLLADWLPSVYRNVPELTLQVELIGSAALVSRVREQSLDLAILYEPPQVSDLQVDALATIDLVLVTSGAGLTLTDPLPGYVYVDWGTSFNLRQARELPRPLNPLLRVDSPELARDFLTRWGGTAYLPRPLVASDLEAGRLHPVVDAPVIPRRTWLIRNTNTPASTTLVEVRAQLLQWLGVAAE